jgi:hypothetical protein
MRWRPTETEISAHFADRIEGYVDLQARRPVDPDRRLHLLDHWQTGQNSKMR